MVNFIRFTLMDNSIADISKVNQLKPKKGRLLLAEPFMLDDHFSRSVIFICEHNKDGSYGFIINNQLNLNLDEILPNSSFPSLDVFYGGPVHASNLFYIHQYGEIINDSIKIAENIWTGGDFNQLTEYLDLKIIESHKIKFFLGYSGWSKNQLKEEIKTNSWIISEGIGDKIFSNNKNFWKDILEKKGGRYKAIANFPLNPSDN